MAGPGSYLIGREKREALLEVIEAGYLFRYGDIGGMSFNVYKTITAGDGGMVVKNSEELYRRAFAIHDQGHLPLRQGAERRRTQ